MKKNQTQLNIAEILFSLLEESPLNEITISELTAYSSISRAIFYRQFGSKEEVILNEMRKLKAAFISDFYEQQFNASDSDVYIILTKYHSFYWKNRKLVHLFYKQNLLHYFFNLFTELADEFHRPCFENLVKQNLPIDDLLTFFSSGIYGLFCRWTEKNLDGIDNQIGELEIKNLEKSLTSILKN